MPEPIQNAVSTWIHQNRRFLVWSIFSIVLLWVAVQVKEVTSLLFASYFIAVLIDPVVSRLEKRKISRSFSIIGMCVLLVLVVLGFVAIVVPAFLHEYTAFMKKLPLYLDGAGERFSGVIESITGMSAAENVRSVLANIKEYLNAIEGEQIKNISNTVRETLLTGYSFTLTIFNLTLLPFFVYYIARDLKLVHRFLSGFIPEDLVDDVQIIGTETVDHLHAFFKGQLTVAGLMAVLYAIGLSIIGLPWAVVVGVLAGFLNIVPYLGVAIGMVLSIVITLFADPSVWAVAQVLLVFGVVGAIEGAFLTPKIVGDSVGIHPLGVIVALIIGGQLFGLVGMILAIPGAAALRVLFRHVLENIDPGEVAPPNENLDESQPSPEPA